MHQIVPLLWRAIGWLSDSMPDISNLILILVGVIMSLPKLAEKIEDHSAARYTLATGCIILGLAGFAASVHQRHQFNSQISQLISDSDKLVKDDDALIGNTGNLVTSFGVLMPKLSGLEVHISDLDVKIAAAREKHDPKLIADLQSQAAAAKVQVDGLYRTLLLSLAPGIVSNMQAWRDKWDSDDRGWVSQLDQIQLNLGHDASPQEIEAAQRPVRQRQTQMDKDHTLAVLPMMTSANYLREQLLRGTELTADDHKNALIFDDILAGKPIHWYEMKQVTTYMALLVGKYPVQKPPTAIKETPQ